MIVSTMMDHFIVRIIKHTHIYIFIYHIVHYTNGWTIDEPSANHDLLPRSHVQHQVDGPLVIPGTDCFRMLLGRGSEQVEKTDARPMGDLVLPSLISHLIPIYIRNWGDNSMLIHHQQSFVCSMVTNDNQPRLTITNHHEALTSTIIIFQRRELGVHSTGTRHGHGCNYE